MRAVLPEQLCERITIQRDTVGSDSVGGVTHTWGDLATVWARYRPRAAGERDQARQEQGNEVAEFVVRSSSTTRTVTVADRISFQSSIWAIRSALPLDELGRRTWVQLIAERETP